MRKKVLLKESLCNESVLPETVAQLYERVKIIEHHISEFEEREIELDRKLSDIDNTYEELIVKFGNRIGARIDKQVDANIDEIEYRILKKLVDGNMFELNMKNWGKNGSEH